MYTRVNNEIEDEIQRILLQLNKSANNKTKVQIVKKLVMYYKKNINDKLKLSNFYMKISSHLNESVNNIKEWIKYVYNKMKIEFYVGDIQRKILKLFEKIDINSVNDSNEFNVLKCDNMATKSDIISIYNKLKEMNDALEESVGIENNDNVKRIIDEYNPSKYKKKILLYKGKLIKKVIGIYNHKQKVIDEKTVEKMLFNNNTNNRINNNITFNSIRQASPPKTNVIEVNLQNYINNDYIIKNEPIKSHRYLIKQFSEDDFFDI